MADNEPNDSLINVIFKAIMNSDITLNCGCYPLVFVAGTCSFFGGMIALGALSGNAEVGLVIGMIVGPPGLFLLGIGVSLMLVKLQVRRSSSPIRIAFRLPRAGSAPLVPMMLHQREVSPSELYRVDIMLRPNVSAVGGFERLVHLRTVGGDFYFSSRWFAKWQEFEDFVQQQGIHTLIGSVDEVMDRIAALPPAPTATEEFDSAASDTDKPIGAAPALEVSPTSSELVMRGCGWVMFAVLLLILLLGTLVAVFGDPEDRRGGWIAVLIAALAIGAVKMMTSYRQAK